MTDDFGGGIALDALGGVRPVAHAPVRVEHDDRVVLDAVDQQPVSILAGGEALLCNALLGQIAVDLANPSRCPELSRIAAITPLAKKRAVAAQVPTLVARLAGLRRQCKLPLGDAGRESRSDTGRFQNRRFLPLME